MSPALFHTGLGLLLTVLSLIGVGVLFWLALRRPSVRRPSCGSCGYSVEGLEALSCPECGSDLRAVGIETPRGRMLHPGLFVLGWTLLLIVPCLTGYSIAMSMAPRIHTIDARFGIRTLSGSMPELIIGQRMQGTATRKNVFVSSATAGTSVENGVTRTDMQFPKVNGATMVGCTVDIRTADDAERAIPARVTLDGRHGDAGTVDAATLKVVLGQDELASTEDALEVALLLNALMRGEATFSTSRLGMAGTNSVTNRARMAGWYGPVLVLIGALIYGLGLVLFAILRRRRLAG